MWPENHLHDENNSPIPFHFAQQLAWDCKKRLILMSAGSQGGKTSWGPHWLKREIDNRKGGDFLAVTASYDLFRLKMLPAMLAVFEQIYGIGRYWVGDKLIEILDPTTGEFWAKRSSDAMWGRVILRSADALGGLESSTARAAWLDECLAPETIIDTEIGKFTISDIVNNHMDVRVWSYDTNAGIWELKPIIRWVKILQHENLINFGNIRITPHHRVWTKDGYVEVDKICSACYSSVKAEQGANYVWKMRVLSGESYKEMARQILQSELCQKVLFFESREPQGDLGSAEGTVQKSSEQTLESERWEFVKSFREIQNGNIRELKASPTMETWWERSSEKLAAGEISISTWLAERVCCSYWQSLDSSRIQDRCCRTCIKDCNRSRERSEYEKDSMVFGEWVDISSFLEQNGGNLDGGSSGDGFVYNIEVERNHNYVAGGILVENCGQDKFTLSAYKAIRRRLAIERGKMLLTTTLYNLGWLTNNILDPILRSGETRVTNIGDSEVDYTVSDKMDSAAIQFDSIINPRFPHDEFEEQRKLLSQDEFEMFFRGRKSGRKFLIYNSFDYAKHTCDRFDIPDEWPRYVGIDFGGTHMAVIFFAEKPDTRQLYAYREYFSGDKSIFSHVSDITSGERHIERAVGGAQSEAQWRTEFGAHGMYVEEPPIKDVDLGIQRVYSQFKQDNVIIFNDLSEFLDEIGRYRRKRDSSGQVLDDIENKETFHILDAVRYIVGTIRPGVPLRAKIISLGDINIW